MTTKFPSPLLGYNNNVRHKGKVFHIQTEDSGVKYGHIITHLFMDGGRILKSVKTSYAEYIGGERMADVVREMMKQQHKAMFIALRDGKFDAISEGGADASQATRAVAAESPPAALPPDAAGVPAPLPSEPGPPAPAPRRPTPPPLAVATAPQSSSGMAVPAFPEEAPPTIRQPVVREDLTLDIGALEQAATAAQATSPMLRSASELPPPPANLFRDRGAGGKYRVTPLPSTTAPVPQVPPRPSRPATPAAAAVKPAAATPPPLPRRGSPSAPAVTGERRYAPTRPASIFGAARPQQGKSVFGEDLISDKSLDEVILSYLAEDLDDKPK